MEANFPKGGNVGSVKLVKIIGHNRGDFKDMENLNVSGGIPHDGSFALVDAATAERYGKNTPVSNSMKLILYIKDNGVEGFDLDVAPGSIVDPVGVSSSPESGGGSGGCSAGFGLLPVLGALVLLKRKRG
jgi:hypothetical protein